MSLRRLAIFIGLIVTAAVSVGRVSAEPGRDDYILHCMGCHLDDGRETPGIVPPLTGVARFLAVPGGRKFLVQVPGVSGSPLDDGPLADLMNWVLLEFSSDNLPPDFRPYTAEEVGRYRHTPLAEVETLREKLLAEADARNN